MAISPVDISMMQRMNDVATIRQNEITRPEVQQITIARELEKQTAASVSQVRSKDNADETNTEHDAKEKGSNSYFGDGGKNRKKKQEGKVIIKGSKGFDLKV